MTPHPQAIFGAHPYASISACNHRAPPGDSSQAFVLGVRRDRGVAKTIEPSQGGDPNITFAIFEERGHEIAGESISLRKYVGASLMEMHNTGTRGSNPDAAIAVLENHYPSIIACWTGVREQGFQSAAPEATEPSRQRDQEGSIVGLTQVLYSGCSKWHVVEPG